MADRPNKAVAMNLLFVCSRNRLRSPTAEQIFADVAGVETMSAGTAPDADCRLTDEMVAWADVICVMETHHRNRLNRAFPIALRGKRVVCLGIPDDYDYMQPALIELLWDRVGRSVPAVAAARARAGEDGGRK
jgi:predicted protein tyrosine phosphatase